MIHPLLERLTILIQEALPQGAFFDVWKCPYPSADVYAFYFWGGGVQKRVAIPVKLMRRERGFYVCVGAEAKGRGQSTSFRPTLARLLLHDQQEVEMQIGNPLRIEEVQTIVKDRDRVIIPETDLPAVVERVMRFRSVFTPYITATADRLGLSAIL